MSAIVKNINESLGLPSSGGRRRQKKRMGGEGIVDKMLKGGSEISGAITSPGVADAATRVGGRRSGKRRRKSGSRGGRASRRGRRSRRR